MKKKIDIYDAVLTIGTVAKLVDVAVQTIRMYEQAGLILPVKTSTGRRMYSARDVDRLRCVRNMIREHGLNLNGIKRLMSLLPCWEFKGGLDEDCRHCPAYYDLEGPCWTLRNVGDKCKNANCRDCEVYRMELDCKRLKEIVFGHKRPLDPQGTKSEK
ncbi:MAG: MerR family transcriptional regulator [Calditrichaceae bacterium]